MDKIRKGDEVVVTTGKDKGRRGTVVLRVDADRVVVVTENGIEEQGTYDELVAQGGVFATLHNSQFRESKLGITKE